MLGLEYLLVRERSARVLLAEPVITLSTTEMRQLYGSHEARFSSRDYSRLELLHRASHDDNAQNHVVRPGQPTVAEPVRAV